MVWPADPVTGTFLALFFFGLFFSIASLGLGLLGGHLHLPGADHAGDAGHGHADMGGHADTGGHVDPGHGGHIDTGGHVDTSHGGTFDHSHSGHIHMHPEHGGHVNTSAGADAGPAGLPAAPGPFTLTNLMIFITWFGATGYLLRESGTVIVLTLLIATMIGLLGAALAWIFLAKVLWRGQTQLDPYNYRLEGAVGRVSSTIRAGGTGEIVYHLDGKQRVDGARSNDGSAIPAGSDVVILRFANGIAYVAPQTVSFDGEPLPFEAEAGPAPTPLPAPPTAGEERHETRA